MRASNNIDQNYDHFDELSSDYGDAEYFESFEEDPETGFSIKQPLPAPSATLHTTKQLHAMIHRGDIDLSPEYQRSVVWKSDKQIMLIESIFRNFYVPPVLFHIAETPEGPVRICVDGKQRLTSITRFMDGQIPYRDPKTKKRFFYTVPESQRGKVLQIPPKAKKLFEDKTLTCVEYTDLKPTDERDVFRRVQLGMTLTAAEKLQAISSAYSSWINGLDAKHISGEQGGLARLITWDTDRGRNFLGLASMAYCWENLPLRSDPSSARLTHWLSRLDEPSQKLKDDMESILYKFYTIASSESFRYPFKKMKAKVAPVEFVFIGVLIGVLNHCGNEVIAREIQEFRRHVRQTHVDVRANHKVMATMWEYIENAHEKGGTAWELGSKRKRRADDDEEYFSGPITSLGPTPKTRSRAK